jgi:hypothetical protein
VLDDAEIERTECVCAGSLDVWSGDFTADDWADPAKVTALGHTRVVLGSLTIAATTAVRLPLLELVGAKLTITAGAFAVELPALHTIGEDASIAGAATPSFAMLDRIGGTLSLDGCGHLVDAPSLQAIGGGLAIAPTATSELALPGLQSIGGGLDLRGELTALHLDRRVPQTVLASAAHGPESRHRGHGPSRCAVFAPCTKLASNLLSASAPSGPRYHGRHSHTASWCSSSSSGGSSTIA